MRLISRLLTVSALAGIAVAFLSASPSGLAVLANAAPVPHTADATKARVIANDGAVPEGLSAGAWEAIGQAIERDRYRAEALSDGTVWAANDAQGYTTRFTTRGIRLRPRGSEIEVELALSGYGYSRMQAVGPAQPHAEGNRVEFDRGALTEWYVNRPAGLEQGFTLARPPAEGRGAKPLRLELAVMGPVRAEAAEGGESVLLRDPAGQVQLRFSGLRVWDAQGRELPARLEAGGDHIALLVGDSWARYPLTIDPTIINETAELTASDRAQNDFLGDSVSISGDTVVVGALRDDCAAGIRCGSAYVFEKPIGGWSGALTETAKLNASDPVVGGVFSGSGEFGGSVSISGDTVMVGAEKNDCQATPNPPFLPFGCGAAYVFEKPIGGWSGALTETAKLNTSDLEDRENLFGHSVSISGDTVVVGAPFCVVSCGQGAAYIFEKPIGGWSGTLTETAKLTASDAAGVDTFGNSVSISGDSVVVGARSDPAYVFEKPATGWADTTEDAKLAASDAAQRDFFGFSVSIAGDTVVVGAYNSDGACPDGDRRGSAYVFEKPIGGWSGPLTQNAKLTASDAAQRDSFGFSVSIAGDAVVVGARGDDCAAGQDCGSAYIFVNRPPVADAGSNQTVNANLGSATVTLDGSGSSDPDGDPLTFAWAGPFGTVGGVSPTVTLPGGVHTITLTVGDGRGGVDTDTVTVAVRALKVSPNSLSFLFGKSHGASQPLSIRSVGGRVSYSIPRIASWLLTNPDRGVSNGETDTIEVIVDPARRAGTYSTTMIIRGNGNIMARIPVTMVVPEGGVPGSPRLRLPENPAVDAADFIPHGEPGHAMAGQSIIAIFGEGFVADGEFRADTVPLPTTLGGVRVLFDGTAAPLYLVTPGLIHAQLPMGLRGPTATLLITRNIEKAFSNPQEIEIHSYSPGIFTLSQNGEGQGIVVFANAPDLAAPVGTVGASRPATTGDLLTIYANGMGPVNPPLADGHNSCEPGGVCLPDGSNVVLHHTTMTPVIRIGGVEVPSENVVFSGSSPASVGVNEIVFEMPPGVPTGDAVPITIEIGGVVSRDDVAITVK